MPYGTIFSGLIDAMRGLLRIAVRLSLMGCVGVVFGLVVLGLVVASARISSRPDP